MAKPEAQIQKQILDYLAAKHILAFRMQTGASMLTYGGKTRMVRYGTPGMADILAFPKPTWMRSNVLWIEVKAPKGKQSELQASFQRQVENQDHAYLIARSLDDVINILG